MWAGDQTTLADTYDFVWKESMAEYLAFVWEDMNDPTVVGGDVGVWKADARGREVLAGAARSAGAVRLLQRRLRPRADGAVPPARGDVVARAGARRDQERARLAARAVGRRCSSRRCRARPASISPTTSTRWIKGMGAPNWPLRQDHVHRRRDARRRWLARGHDHEPDRRAPRGCQFHVALGDGGANSVEGRGRYVHNGPTQTLMVPTPAFTVSTIELDPASRVPRVPVQHSHARLTSDGVTPVAVASRS